MAEDDKSVIRPDKDEYGGTGSNMLKQWGTDVSKWPYESRLAKGSKKIDESKWAY